MNPGQGGAAGHMNATPDRGVNTQQGDGELVDRRPRRHADKYVVLFRHIAMGILLENPWTFVDVRGRPRVCGWPWWLFTRGQS